MAFQNPWLLLGLLAVAVPVWIHLRNRRQVTRVRWGAMRFLRTAVERHEKRLRVENLVLLAARCAVVGLLAVALARPVGCASEGGGAGNTVVLLDVSGSMQVGDGAGTRMEAAKKAGMEVLDRLGLRRALAVWGVSDSIDAWIPEPTRDHNLARKVMSDAVPTDRGTSLLPAVSQATAMLARLGRGSGGQVVVVTDGSQRVFSDENGWAEVGRRASEANVSLKVVVVGAEPAGNLAITDMRQETGGGRVVALTAKTSSPEGTAGRRVRYGVAVRNFGPSEAKGIRVVLKVRQIGGEDLGIVDEARLYALPAGEVRDVAMFVRYRGPGVYAVRAEVVTGDANSDWDNARSIVTEVRSAVRVLVVGDQREGSDEARDNSGFYVRQLLSALAYQVDARSYREFASARLADYDVVLLTDMPALGPAEADALLQYVRAGGGVLAFAGSRTEAGVEVLNRELGDRRGLLPGKLGTARGELATTRPVTTLMESGEFSVMSGGTVSVSRLLPLQSLTADSRTVVLYADRTPAVASRIVDRGRVMFVTTAADMSWSDLPVRVGVWVPLLDRLVGTLAGGQRVREVLTGQPFVEQLGADSAGRSVKAVAPSGQAISSVSLERTPQGMRVMLGETDHAGVYAATVGDDQLAFAAVSPPAESETERIGPPDVEKLRAIGISVDGLDETNINSKQAATSSELGMTMLWLLLVLAMLESLAAWRFGRPR